MDEGCKEDSVHEGLQLKLFGSERSHWDVQWLFTSQRNVGSLVIVANALHQKGCWRISCKAPAGHSDFRTSHILKLLGLVSRTYLLEAFMDDGDCTEHQEAG